MIWILHDRHWAAVASRVQRHLEVAGRSALLVDEMNAGELSLAVDPGHDPALRIWLGDRELELPTAVLALRVPTADAALVASLDEEAGRFVTTQWQIMVRGLLFGLERLGIKVVNRMHAALWDEKTAQLLLAAEAGFAIPQTLQTATPVGLGLVEIEGDVAVKPFRPYRKVDELAQTQQRSVTVKRTRGELVADVAKARCASPMVIQPFVDAPIEHRVVVVGSRVYAAERRRSGANSADVRNLPIGECEVEQSQLPQQVVDASRRLVASAGLDIGVLDLLETSDGFVFLDLNPGGHYLWVEQMTGAPITKSIAELLMCTAAHEQHSPA